MSLAQKQEHYDPTIKVALLEQSLLHMSKTLDSINANVVKLEDEMKGTFRFLIGLIITLFSGLYATALGGMLLRLCKWI